LEKRNFYSIDPIERHNVYPSQLYSLPTPIIQNASLSQSSEHLLDSSRHFGPSNSMASATVVPHSVLGRIFGLDLLPVAVQGSMAAADILEAERHDFPATKFFVDCIDDHQKALREQGSRSLVAVVVAVATQAAADTSFRLVFPPSCSLVSILFHEGARESNQSIDLLGTDFHN
jgi:hypothetical protein